MSLDSNAEREAFESAIAAKFPHADMGRYPLAPDVYANSAVANMWDGWQLARSQPSEWVAVSERIPEDWQDVIMFIPDAMNQFKTGHWFRDEGGEQRINIGGTSGPIGGFRYLPTHWAPVPKPPALLPPNTEAKS